MKEYWENRFREGKKIWGSDPSLSARQAAVLFESGKAESILVPGCGYGRHTKFFDEMGFDTEGIEIAGEALKIAKEESPHLTFYEGSVLDMSQYIQRKYDAIYCYNVVHLFNAQDRERFIAEAKDRLKNEGLIYFTVFSEGEESFGKGEMTEENTFESKPGRPVHYFTEEDLKQSFKEFQIIGTGIIEEEENHGAEGHHIHKLRYLFAKKQGE